MTDSAVVDLDSHVLGTKCAALELQPSRLGRDADHACQSGRVFGHVLVGPALRAHHALAEVLQQRALLRERGVGRGQKAQA